MEYKWTLRKGGKKLTCPQCQQKRFVPYVSTADLKTLAGNEYGRCDREQSCGYNRYPGKEVSADGIAKVEIKPKPPLRFYPAAVQTDTRTALFVYVSRLLGVGNALAIWERYKIGRDGSRTLFWQIAKDGTVRAGKSIPYAENGHRIKTDEHPANWLHCLPEWRAYKTGYELQQCYFGEHLLNASPGDKVVIVESEKTAAVLSQVSHGWVWLASGGSQGLKNPDKNKALEGREVWLLPDHGQYWNWATIAHENGWHIFDALEKSPIFEGCDILDMLEAGALGMDLLKYAKL